MRYYTKREVADMFCVQPNTVLCWVRSGKIQSTQGEDRVHKFSDKAIEDFKKGVKYESKVMDLHIRLTPSNYEFLRNLADKRQTSMQETVNKLIEEKENKHD